MSMEYPMSQGAYASLQRQVDRLQTENAGLLAALKAGMARANGWQANDGTLRPVIDWQRLARAAIERAECEGPDV